MQVHLGFVRHEEFNQCQTVQRQNVVCSPRYLNRHKVLHNNLHLRRKHGSLESNSLRRFVAGSTNYLVWDWPTRPHARVLECSIMSIGLTTLDTDAAMASDGFGEGGAANLNQCFLLMIGGPDRTERVLLKTNFNTFLESADLALSHRHPKLRFFAWLPTLFLTQKAYHQLNGNFFSSTDGTQCIHLGTMD